MERRTRRTVIDISDAQPEFDFDEAEQSPWFSFPEYQRGIIGDRLVAELTDFGVVAVVYIIFVIATFLQMPDGIVVDRRTGGIYAVGFFLFAVVYFLLYMLSASQTPGMKLRQLVVVTREGALLDARSACIRSFGYLISILPLMLGFLWAAIDPEHLSWADKVSGTYLKKL